MGALISRYKQSNDCSCDTQNQTVEQCQLYPPPTSYQDNFPTQQQIYRYPQIYTMPNPGTQYQLYKPTNFYPNNNYINHYPVMDCRINPQNTIYPGTQYVQTNYLPQNQANTNYLPPPPFNPDYFGN